MLRSTLTTPDVTARPFRISEVVASFCSFADALCDDDGAEQLRAVLSRTIGTHTTLESDDARTWQMATWLYTWWLADVAERVGDVELSEALAAAGPIDGPDGMRRAVSVLRAATPVREWFARAIDAWVSAADAQLNRCDYDYFGALHIAWGSFLRALSAAHDPAAVEVCRDAMWAMSPLDEIERLCLVFVPRLTLMSHL